MELEGDYLFADIGAERTIGEQSVQATVVEVKSFAQRFITHALEEALGQYQLYRRVLSVINPNVKIYLDRYHSLNPNVETLFYQDDPRGRYPLFATGWDKQQPISSVIMAVRIKEGKIWIDEDATEEGIANALIEAGVPEKDVVLAFHHPSLRETYAEAA